MKKMFFVVGMALICLMMNRFVLGASANMPRPEMECRTLYWIDNENKSCGQREFCGAFMYYGLQTFESKEQCEKAVNNLNREGCTVDSDCVNMKNCPASALVYCDEARKRCIEGRCKKVCPNDTLEENGSCYKAVSGGRKAEIKIMPERASQRAVERLGELGFNVSLKEVGKGNETRVVYELTGRKEGKFLGIFKIITKVKAEVDAENGDVKVIKPWWSFLVSGFDRGRGANFRKNYNESERKASVGGCAGVSQDNLQECCNRWARENGIMRAQCVGNWIIKNEKCAWNCAIE